MNQYSDIISDGGMDPRNPPTNYGAYNDGVMAERNRIVNMFMIMHEAAKSSHNYWHVAANLVQADVASDT